MQPKLPQILMLLLVVSSITSSRELSVQAQSQFVVPEFVAPMATLDRLHKLHQPAAFTNCTLWDRWLPHATLWTGTGPQQRYRESLLNRRIDAQGYVAMQQHRGMAHSDGWPFPAWQQSTGQGFHFSTEHESWAVQHFQLTPASDAAGWQFEGIDVIGVDPSRGLQLQVREPVAKITTPQFRCGTIVAPFVRLELAADQRCLASDCSLRWLLDGETGWNPSRRVPLKLSGAADQMNFENIPLYVLPEYAGIVTQYQLELRAEPGSRLDLKSLLTAIDTRHPITNSNYLRACVDYCFWTQDREFLRMNLPRMRAALGFLIEEFGLRHHHHVVVPWVGHEGRSGLAIDAAGNKQIRPGVGVGNNYWDLLPFGGHDALATIYACDALNLMAQLETAIATHPEWQCDRTTRFDAASLANLSQQIKTDFQQRFWNATEGRFVGWIDLDGKSYDYGFTFVNLEAIAYGLASNDQAIQILDWLDGKRIVAGDTSQGEDIYRWRFAPRATTRRNVETYVWVWSGPESIPWGGQVQDGGAVLGFSYYDLLARLKTRGPDDAWQRLESILEWYNDIETAGGYRAYYQNPERGTLQGGGTAGGLGLDHEFLESVLVPQIMLYGFLGFRPTADGFELNPQLPSDWPSLTVKDIHWGDHVLTITVDREGRQQVDFGR